MQVLSDLPLNGDVRLHTAAISERLRAVANSSAAPQAESEEEARGASSLALLTAHSAMSLDIGETGDGMGVGGSFAAAAVAALDPNQIDLDN